MAAIKFSDDMRIAVAANQVSCDLAGEAAILNLKSCIYYGLDSVGSRVWSLIQKPSTLAEIRNVLLSIYDVDGGDLESDLRELLTQLSEHGLIEVQN